MVIAFCKIIEVAPDDYVLHIMSGKPLLALVVAMKETHGRLPLKYPRDRSKGFYSTKYDWELYLRWVRLVTMFFTSLSLSLAAGLFLWLSF